MSSKYPENLNAHVKELRRDFQTALASTQGVRTPAPISQHVSNLISSGIRKGLAEALSQDRYIILHSKQAKNDVKDVIHSHISSALLGQLHASVTPDGVPQATLKSLYASFLDLTHKYKIGLGANIQFAGTNEHSSPASLDETGLKVEASSSPPPVWQRKRNDLILEKANSNTLLVSLADNLIEPGMNDVELTRLINQSIGSDPEIPSHLRNSKWITSATLLDSGQIEIHTETADDRDFLALNTHWRPKLKQTLAARQKLFTEAMAKSPFQKFNPTTRAHENPAITREADVQDIPETESLIPINMPSSRPEQASGAFYTASPGEESGYCPLPTTNQQEDRHTTVPANMGLSYHRLARAQLLELTTNTQAASIQPDNGYKKRGIVSSIDFPCSDEGTKRMRIGIEE